MGDVENPHDRFARTVFGRPENAEGLLRSVLPADVVQRIDFATLALDDGNLLDHVLSERRTDVLFTAQLAERDALIWVLIEHQSTQDRLLGLRLLIYMGRIWDRWLQRNKARRPTRVPPILPVVLYHGPDGWTAPTSFHELLDVEPALLGAVGEYVPAFRFALDDLARYTDAEIRQRQVAILGRVALLLLRHVRDEPEEFLGVLRTVSDLLQGLGGWEDLSLVFSYILEAAEPDPQHVLAALRDVVAARPEVREAVMTAAEKLRAEGQRRVLLRQLRKRFGVLSAEVVQRIEAASEAQLDTWADRILNAQTIEAVFSEAAAE